MSYAPCRHRAGLIALCSVLVVGVAGPEAASAAKKKKPTVITSKQIKNGTIQSKDLAKSVQAKINAGAKALKVIANGSVGTAQLADNSVSGAKIAALAVTTAKLAEGAVTSGKLADASVTNPKLGDDAVTAAKVAPDAVGSSELAAGAVTAPELAAGSVTSDKLAARGTTTIDLPNIVAGGCTTEDSIDTDTGLTGDTLMVTADENLAAAITVRASPVSPAGQNIRLNVCNVSGAPINPAPVSFSWAVLEN